jgi:hypothetical protein
MLRICVGALFLSACGFTNEVDRTLEVDGGTDPNTNPNPNPSGLRCNAADQNGMILCVDFEDAPGFDDFFGTNTTATYVASMDRVANEKAAEFAQLSLYTIDDAPKFNVSQLTIEMWARPTSDPGGMNEQGLFDNHLGYKLSYEGGRQIECQIGSDGFNHSLDSKVSISLDWHHVACTYNGNELRVYVDGKLEGCRSFTTPIPNYGAYGAAIGANISGGPTYVNRFVGQIDNVRVYNRKLEAADICKIATGGTGCSNECD